ncbi:MAG: AAA family ATPase [Candidatus Sumerlaeota bacterium]|nr:AAA family ATPase [Candidatus Sumerlaeota bacterium]
MDRMTRLKISGFRRLHNLDLEIKPLNVLIGANGVGKSSLLDAISLLSSCVEGKMNDQIIAMGGISNLLTSNGTDTLSLAFNAISESDKEKKSTPIEYSLHLKSQDSSYVIFQENLADRNAKCSRNNGVLNVSSTRTNPPKRFRVNNSASLLSSRYPEGELVAMLDRVRMLLYPVALYHTLNIDPRAPIRLPQQISPSTSPGKDGETLLSFLYNLRESDPDRYELLEDTLHAAYPGFAGLGFPSVAAGMVAMTWKEKSFSTPFYINQLSEGTLRFLWLAALLASPNLAPITMIDEPEVSLHPELLSLLVHLLREASSGTTLFVATHSDSLVRFLKPEEVIVMDLHEDGIASATRADTFDLEEWLKDYSLEEIWHKGLIGGRSCESC